MASELPYAPVESTVPPSFPFSLSVDRGTEERGGIIFVVGCERSSSPGIDIIHLMTAETPSMALRIAS